MDIPLSGVWRAASRVVSRISGERTLGEDSYTVEPGFYPLEEAGPLGKVRRVDGNHFFIKDDQVAIFLELQRQEQFAGCVITTLNDGWNYVSWDENESQK